MNKWLSISLPLAVVAGSVLITVFLVRSRPVVETKAPGRPASAGSHNRRDVGYGPAHGAVPGRGDAPYRKRAFRPRRTVRSSSCLLPSCPAGSSKETSCWCASTRATRNWRSHVPRRIRPGSPPRCRSSRRKPASREDEWRRLGSGAPMPLVLREPQLAQARANLEASVAALQQAKLNLERTEIRAPYAGRVRKKNVDAGQFLRRGEALATIYAINYAEIRLPIPDEELAYFDTPMQFRGETARASGPRVVISAEFAGRRHRWDGTVVRMEGEIDPLSRMVYAVARVQNPYGRGANPDRPPLGIGMFVEAEILGRRYPEVAVLPRTAMHGENRIAIVDDENRLRFRRVEILRIASDQVYIQSGIETGERVCLSALETQVDGMEVRILESSSSGTVVQEEEGTGR